MHTHHGTLPGTTSWAHCSKEREHCRVARGALLLASLTFARAGDLTIYDDALQNGFSTGYSYNNNGGDLVVGSTAQAHTGTKSIALTGNGSFNALSFTGTTSNSTDTYPILHFWIFGNAPGSQSLYVEVRPNRDSDTGAVSAPLNSYIAGGSVGNGVWREVTVDVRQPPLSYTGTIDRIDLQTQATQSTVYFDDVALQSAIVDPIFSNGFESGNTPPPPANALTETANQSNGGMNAELFAWDDSNAQRRTAALAYNDGASGPGGSRGGELRQFSYHVGANVRTVNASSAGAAGFGYVVSHPKDDEEFCVGGMPPPDSSSLGHFTRRYVDARLPGPPPRDLPLPAKLSALLQHRQCRRARHSSDHRLGFLDRPRQSAVGDLVRSLGIHPEYSLRRFARALWRTSVRRRSDRRWPQRHRRRRLGRRIQIRELRRNPVTLQSDWSWNQANTIPYVKLWTTADRCHDGNRHDTTDHASMTSPADFGVRATGTRPAPTGAAMRRRRLR